MNKTSSLVALFAVLICVIACGKSDEEKRLDQAKRDRPAKFAAARLDLAKKPAKTELVKDPYIKGKVVVLGSTDSGEPGYQTTPGLTALEAMTPEEVGTVVLKDCRSAQKGVYRTTDNPPREVPAKAIDCDVLLIDRPAGTIYYTKHFEGKLSEEASISKISNSVASGPDQEINEFLLKLPRK